jgi:hypothetical protein
VQSKRETIHNVKYWKTALALLAVLSTSLVLAEDFKTINGKEYKNATVSHIDADGIVLKTKLGISKVYFTELPKEVQKRFGYGADKLGAEKDAASAAEEKQIEEQKAAERGRAEKEKNAEADLKRSVEEFQAAEQSASKAYGSAAKGTLSGQVFVSTAGGENVKLGAVQIGLFARDAIDALLPVVKKYADFKIQELRRSVAEAKAAEDQAEASQKAAWEALTGAILGGRGDYEAKREASDRATTAAAAALRQHLEMKEQLKVCYSGGFYLALLQSPIRTAETDADGKFVIEVPKTGPFVIAAQAQRRTLETTERYYWLQPVSLEGQQQLTQNLSNNDLTSTTGSSSLIHTQD